uniref:Ovule protein n=1 Tax=Haemonchus placei TaxID=6290 RepID=A0A0N4WX82_HAEPC
LDHLRSLQNLLLGIPCVLRQIPWNHALPLLHHVRFLYIDFPQRQPRWRTCRLLHIGCIYLSRIFFWGFRVFFFRYLEITRFLSCIMFAFSTLTFLNVHLDGGTKN